MTVVNGDFKQAGATRYEAAGWVRETRGGDFYAPFVISPAGALAAEPFELPLVSTLSPVIAWFDSSGDTPKSVEDFEDLWAARPATLRTLNKAPFVLAHGQTLTVRVNDRPPQVLVFLAADFTNIAHVGAEELARVIDRQLVSADARMTVDGLRVEMLTVRLGLKAHLEVMGGSAAAALNFRARDGQAVEAQGTGETGTFYRTAEFDFLDFQDSAAPEAETFGKGVNVSPVIALRPVSTFDGVLIRTKDDWTLPYPAEHFFGFTPELTVNF